MTPHCDAAIDLTCDYPCPCGRGRLQRITLTDTLGCDRCDQLFEVSIQGEYLEQVVTPRPQRLRWRWTGKRWQSVPNGDRRFKFTRFEGFGLFLGTIACILMTHHLISANLVYAALLLVLLVVVPGLMFWLTDRQ